MKLLTFLLAGPLQSWGGGSRWDYRLTEAMPTKSAVIGLLGCCMGYPRGDMRLAELSKKLHMAVRADRGGRVIMDFQTVQNPGGMILNTEGKPRCETIAAHKQYIQDGAFQVFLFGDEEALEQCRRAMLSPKWVACLGRRSCPPSYPIIPEIIVYETVDEALKHSFSHSNIQRDKAMLCRIECLTHEPITGKEPVFMDEPIRADKNIYAQRRTRMITVQREEHQCTLPS